MVPAGIVALIWQRAKAIPTRPGSWSRLLASIMAAAWAAALWMPVTSVRSSSGTADVIAAIGIHPAALWMSAVAILPLAAYLADNLAMRVAAAVLSMTTWVTLLYFMLLHAHVYHLSAGTCLVGILACARSDWRLLSRLSAPES